MWRSTLRVVCLETSLAVVVTLKELWWELLEYFKLLWKIIHSWAGYYECVNCSDYYVHERDHHYPQCSRCFWNH
jgi:hypothetical protein